MARGGFYAIENSEIRFGRDGRWYADGQVVDNQRIADLFSRHVQRRPDGGYVLRIADEQASIVVEDTPYVVTGVGLDAAGGLRLDLNDCSHELLDPSTLRADPANVLYCRVKGGTEPARFLRAAYYQIAPYVAVDGSGAFVLRLPRGDHRIGRR